MTFDFTPFYRSTIGYDRVFDVLGRLGASETLQSWPPYDIERTGEDDYRITMAVAGFSENDIEIVQERGVVVVTGRKKNDTAEGDMLYRGIAGRPFRQTFELADHVKVTGAGLQDGLLTIGLKREVPEALKPRRIAIGATSAEAPTRIAKAA